MSKKITVPANNKIHVHISFGNAKLGKTIPSINLPAIITCRPDAPCAKCTKEGGGCYANHGHWTLPAVQKCMKENLQLYCEEPERYFKEIEDVFKFYTYVRFHSSGDIVNAQYFELMCKMARKIPHTTILCFTKKYEIVNAYLDSGRKIPRNLKIIFSCWENFTPENPYNFPMTYVKFRDEKRNTGIPASAVECSGKCEECLACWNLKKGSGIYFHKH